MIQNYILFENHQSIEQWQYVKLIVQLINFNQIAMFQKIMGKKRKDSDTYEIPEKKFATDPKAIAKLSSKNVLELVNDQDKYISILIQKVTMLQKQIQAAKSQYIRLNQKYEEILQKNEIINGEMLRITNEHEELTIKFDNLQSSLEMMSIENEKILNDEQIFMKNNDIASDKIKNIEAILALYKNKVLLCKKIELQNKTLKGKYSDLEEELEIANNKLKEMEKEKGYNNLIPSLMQELQDLKKVQEHSSNKQNKGRSEEELLNKFEQQLLQKVKAEIETVGTQRSTSEEELKQSSANLQIIQGLQSKNKRLSQQLLEFQQKIVSLQAEKQRFEETVHDLFNQIQEINAKCQALYKKCLNSNSQKEELEKILEDYEEKIKKYIQTEQEIKELLKLSLIKNQQNQKQIKNKQEIFIRQISQKESEIQREKIKQKQLQSMLESQRQNKEIENLLKMKRSSDEELERSQSENKKIMEKLKQSQKNIKQILIELQSLKISNKQMIEQKKILQSTNVQFLASCNEKYSLIFSENEQLKNNIEMLKIESVGCNEKLKTSDNQIKNLSLQIQSLMKNIQSKQNQLKRTYSQMQQKQKQKIGLTNQIQSLIEEYKIKSRKYECQLNQERIKNESMSRKVNNFETKNEESKTSMDSMYEQLITKDKKISHLEIKLKQYKYMIQVLRKEKEELQTNYQHKIKGFQNQIPEEESDDNTSKHSQPNQEERSPSCIIDDEIYLKNQIMSMKEHDIILKEENQKLRQKIKHMEEEVHQKNTTIKTLQVKRDQTMREIEKMNFRQIVKQPEIDNKMNLPKENGCREKKIASKAFKGFDILVKLNQQLYKNFINVFTKDLHREEVKNIEGEINVLVTKSSDMKDIFQDYL